MQDETQTDTCTLNTEIQSVLFKIGKIHLLEPHCGIEFVVFASFSVFTFAFEPNPPNDVYSTAANATDIIQWPMTNYNQRSVQLKLENHP